MRPANLTWGMCREVQYMPSKSQIAFALPERKLLLASYAQWYIPTPGQWGQKKKKGVRSRG